MRKPGEVDMLGSLFLGVFLGFVHAFEADHLAAVLTLATRRAKAYQLGLIGAAWGLGHTASLMVLCAIAAAFGVRIGATAQHVIEALIGAMLIFLGFKVVRQIITSGTHIHVHEHQDGTRHVHLHSHSARGSNFTASSHEHEHIKQFALRSLGVGMAHGMAGSAALIAIAVTSMDGSWEIVAYALAFGLGSVFGMTAVTAAAALPISVAERAGTRFFRAIQLAAAALSIIVGSALVLQHGASLGFVLRTT